MKRDSQLPILLFLQGMTHRDAHIAASKSNARYIILSAQNRSKHSMAGNRDGEMLVFRLNGNEMF